MDRKEKFENWAKTWEDKLPNLAKALRSEDLQKSCSDLEEYDGWIRCTTSVPKDCEDVLVTNGKLVWVGDYNSKRREQDGGKWAVVYNGSSPFESTDIIAWTYMPSVPPELTQDKLRHQ